MRGHFRRTAVAFALAALVAAAVGCNAGPDEDAEHEQREQARTYFPELYKLLPKSAEVDNWNAEALPSYIHAEDVPVGRPTAAGGEQPPQIPENVKSLTVSTLVDQSALLTECGFRKAAMQTYVRGEQAEQITLTVYELGDSDDSYSLLTLTADGQRYPGNWLQGRLAGSSFVFAKGRYLVRVEKRSQLLPGNALTDLAKSVAGKISSTGLMPRMVQSLPSADLVGGSVVYVLGPEGLKTAREKSESDFGPLSPEMLDGASMVVATYETGQNELNTIFVADLLGSDTSPAVAASQIESAMATATPGQLNTFAYQMFRSRYVVGTFNPEIESLQLVLPELMNNLY